MPRPLILVPTELERRALAPALTAVVGPLELCGFGPVAAAARTALLLGRLAPERVILVGIAGRFDERLAIGSARRFSAVACHGIGVGSGDAFEPAAALGWPQWPGAAAHPEPVGDVISLGSSSAADNDGGLLLTACAASADSGDAATRRRLFPDAVAEDMEGFGVALACRLHGVPLEIVRGISNTAGDRDKTRWRVAEALAAAAGLVTRILEPSP
jgi:futalosine hydrolase